MSKILPPPPSLAPTLSVPSGGKSKLGEPPLPPLPSRAPASTPDRGAPPPPIRRHQGILSSVLSSIIFRLIIAFRTVWLLAQQVAVTSACLAEWWVFHIAVSSASQSQLAQPTASTSRSKSAQHQPSPSSTCPPRSMVARAVHWAIDPARSLPPCADLRVPKHVGIVAPTMARAAWGPYAQFMPIWRRVVPKTWMPRPETQVVAAICQLVALLPDAEFVSVTVLLTPGMDSDALLLALHSTSNSLRRPIEVVTPLAATVLPASPSSLASPTASAKPRLSRRLSCLTRPGAHGTRPGIPLTVYLADPAIHGRSLIARYASPALSPDESDPAHISKQVLPDPDLVILGVPSCVLMGYPPWGLRLTELHHERAAWMVTPARVVRAVRRYQGVEQRYGK